MTIAFYEHPFSSYVQKAKTALYEKGAGGTPDQVLRCLDNLH
jgi:hypothetical protein